MSNFQLSVDLMDRIMSTSIILLDQNFIASDVIMVFEASVLSPAAVWGGIDDIVLLVNIE